MRGRWPSGREYIDKLTGSDETKARLKAIFDTMYAGKRLQEACAEVGVGETRLHQLREVALQAALTAIEPRPAGRPSRAVAAEPERIRTLEQRVKDLELALHEAQVREEIALVLPHLRQPSRPVATSVAEGVTTVAEEKKTRLRRLKIRKPR
jgi:hypothetical protein